MNSKGETDSNIYDGFLLLSQTMGALEVEDLSTVKEKLGTLLQTVTADIDKGRALVQTLECMKNCFRIYINPLSDNDTRKLVFKIWEVILEDDVKRGLRGVENMYRSVYELNCIQRLGEIAVSYVEDREEECLQLHNRHHYLTTKSTTQRRTAPKRFKDIMMKETVSKVQALIFFPAIETVLTTLRALHALMCTYAEAERGVVESDLGPVLCQVLERHGTVTEVIVLCLKITKTGLPSIYEIEKVWDSFFKAGNGSIHIILLYASRHAESETVMELACSLFKNILTKKSSKAIDLEMDVQNFMKIAQEKYPSNANIEVDARQILFMLTHGGGHDTQNHDGTQKRRECGSTEKGMGGGRRRSEEREKKERRKKSVRERTVHSLRRTEGVGSPTAKMERLQRGRSNLQDLPKKADNPPERLIE